MFKNLFDIEADENVIDVQFAFGNDYWWLALVVLVGLAAYSVYLYRSESWLSKNRRLAMGGCYLLAGFLIIMILLEPALKMKSTRPQKRSVLVLMDVSESMNISDVGENENEGGAPDPKDANQSTNGDASTLEPLKASRLDSAKNALTGIDEQLREKYNLKYYTFGDKLSPLSFEGNFSESFRQSPPNGKTSQVGSAIEEAVARHLGQPLAGVIVLSDFAWIDGSDPADAARDMQGKSIPVHTMTFGMPSPPDVKVRKIIAPEVAFSGDKIPLRVQVDSSGFNERIVEVVLQLNEETIKTEELKLSGSSQFVEFEFVPEKGSKVANLAASIEKIAGETTDANNLDKHKIEIIDEKINVLYVEGMPRWEFRYLRWVLLRDPRLNVRFLMTEGDNSLAATSPRHLGAFPSQAEEMLKYDLVILGDVGASYFTKEQIDWMEELVKGSKTDSGGSLLMLAGPVGAPSSYFGTKIADMLPINMDRTSRQWYNSSAHPVVTPEGLESSVVSLNPSKDLNQRIWKSVTPMGYMNELTPKAGASVLLTLSGNDDPSAQAYPLVAWQRFGSGKSMYVGTADLWRLRREVGDQFHARFWGQAIQFLALSRKLGQNKQITLETGRKQYATGERVELFANVLSESFDPVEEDFYPVFIESNGTDQSTVEMKLEPVMGTPGLYTKSFLAEEDGRFILRAPDSDAPKANIVDFEIENIPLEQRETSMRGDVADQIASISGGKRLSAETSQPNQDVNSTSTGLGKLGKILPGEKANPLPIEREKALWDIPMIFLLLVVLTGIEWYLRRRENLV